ncbi:hypothetical protein GCM10018782_01440 [Streptomyces griseoaurantiacus]|nr:hypothetical protein GCM10018782_01440 [Streptomyces griseoaurantiacus]
MLRPEPPQQLPGGGRQRHPRHALHVPVGVLHEVTPVLRPRHPGTPVGTVVPRLPHAIERRGRLHGGCDRGGRPGLLPPGRGVAPGPDESWGPDACPGRTAVA